MRVLAIDVGTNTVLGCVGERVGDAVILHYDEERIVGLGRGVDARRVLADDRIEAALHAVREHCNRGRELGCERMRAVGTSALRDASNAEVFLSRAREMLDIEVVSGSREAALTFGGAGLGLALSGATAVLDIGGGSTELVLGQHGSADVGDRIESAVSLDIGSVRLFERCLRGDPPTPRELSHLDEEIAAALCGAPAIGDRTLVAVAGTACSVAMLARGRIERVHGTRLTLQDIVGVVSELSMRGASERRAMAGMVAARADVLVAGARILEAVVRRAGLDAVTVSEGGVRHGLLRELLGV